MPFADRPLQTADSAFSGCCFLLTDEDCVSTIVVCLSGLYRLPVCFCLSGFFVPRKAILGTQRYLNEAKAILGTQRCLDDAKAILGTQRYLDDAKAILGTQRYLDDAKAILGTQRYLDDAKATLGTQRYLDDAITYAIR